MDMENDEKQLSEIIRGCPESRETAFEVADILDANQDVTGRKLVIESRELKPEHREPVIAKAMARQHEFHEIEVFAEYLTGDSLALADVDNREIRAVLDEEQETDREIVTYKAKIHPQFKPWHDLLDEATSVKAFAIHCMKHRRTVIEPDGRELALTMSQVKASKNVERWEGVGNKSINGIRVELVINSEKKGELVELPDSIVIESPIFIGGQPQRITIDLTIDQIDDRTVVFCTSCDIEEAMYQSFTETVELLTGLVEGAQVGMGVVSHRDWRNER